jgi:uncharacterized protein YjbJ (UPF0337 family)
MSDLNLNQNSNAPDTQKDTLTDRLKGKVQEAAGEIKERAADAVHSSSEAAQEKVQEAVDAAKGVASDAMDRVKDHAKDKQQSGADFIARFAEDIREAARAFETDAPFAAKGIKSAAAYVEDAGEKIRNGSFRELVDGATDFGKRQPAAFIGLSALAGFAVVRFLRASDGGTSSQPDGG